MIYSNLQVGIVMAGDSTGKTIKLQPSDGQLTMFNSDSVIFATEPG